MSPMKKRLMTINTSFIHAKRSDSELAYKPLFRWDSPLRPAVRSHERAIFGIIYAYAVDHSGLS